MAQTTALQNGEVRNGQATKGKMRLPPKGMTAKKAPMKRPRGR